MTCAATEQAPEQHASGVVETLKRRADFVRASKGYRKTCDSFILQAIKSSGEKTRVGYTATKKTGSAPERNRIRRRLREAVRAADKPALPVDLVIVARRSVLSQPFALLTRDIARSMSALGARIEPQIKIPSA